MQRNTIMSWIAVTMLALAPSVRAQTAPQQIMIGSLYASTGPFASISMPVHAGLEIWISQTNKAGGAYVKAFNKKIPLKLVAYDDQSETSTTATLTNQLITQDKVDVLIADSGSVLTSVSVPIARDHKMFLIDPSGTGAPLFSKDNKYVALVSQPSSVYAVRYLAEFVAHEAAAGRIKRIAILYATNDFTGAQATALHSLLKELHAPVDIVYDKGVPTSTSNYTVLINGLAAAKPDFVVELGYVGNDIAFLRGLADIGVHFPGVFAVYPGWEPEVLIKGVGVAGIKGLFTYVPGVSMHYKPTIGMTADQFHAIWDKTYPDGKVPYGLNAAVGYTTGLAVGAMLAHAPNLTQLGLRQGLYAVSGKMTTIDGPFHLDDEGQQTGELNPIGQLSADGEGGVKLTVVYPPEDATGSAVFGPK